MQQWMIMIQSFMQEYDENNYTLGGVNVCNCKYSIVLFLFMMGD